VTYRFLATAYAHMGRLEEAREIVQRTVSTQAATGFTDSPSILLRSHRWENSAALPLTRRQDIVVLRLREHVRGEISQPRTEPTVHIVHQL
jgi:hypothetical protein